MPETESRAMWFSVWDKSIEARDQWQALPWNHPAERDSNVCEGMQSVDLYGSRKWQSPAYIHPQQPLNFTFQEREYEPQANGRVFFQIGAFDQQTLAAPVDSKRRFTFQSNRAEDGYAGYLAVGFWPESQG